MTDDNGNRSWLVFEARMMPTHNQTISTATPNYVPVYDIPPIAVKAADEQQAAFKAMRQTKRVSVYAVMPAVFIDFDSALGEDDAPETTPGLLTAPTSK